MKKIAFVGPKAYYFSFSFLGASCFSSTKEDIFSTIEHLKKEEFSLIFTTEDLLSEGQDGVVILPGITRKSRGNAIKNEIQRAVGSDISSLIKE